MTRFRAVSLLVAFTALGAVLPVGNIAREFIHGGPHTRFRQMGPAASANQSADSNP